MLWMQGMKMAGLPVVEVREKDIFTPSESQVLELRDFSKGVVEANHCTCLSLGMLSQLSKASAIAKKLPSCMLLHLYSHL